VELSKLISYILRHDPEKYGLTLDRYGFAELKEGVSKIITLVERKYGRPQFDSFGVSNEILIWRACKER